ncbi:RlpA-like double-psi beta-barrel domain-containing protein [Robiginitalea sediminis]|uniref:3D domain-containing protein n=1 Tax=Robiginitalea sediminis TaxID=1982593 RepID=UPI0018E93999|nr:3D domain-containing protein [Robiginitalea sediminis]
MATHPPNYVDTRKYPGQGRPRVNPLVAAPVFIALPLLGACKKNPPENQYDWLPLEVTATAYNASEAQTDGDPLLAAWGDTLSEQTPSIAISRDLLELGLERDTRVRIRGWRDTFLVRDKMNRRFHRHIDIFMGTDVKAARKWGRRKRKIWYRIEKTDTVKRKKYEAIQNR